MMGPSQLQKHLIVLSSDRLNELYEMVDALHDAAVEENLAEFTDMSDAEAIGMLQDMIYTMQQTVQEMRAQKRRNQPVLRVLPRA